MASVVDAVIEAAEAQLGTSRRGAAGHGPGRSRARGGRGGRTGRTGRRRVRPHGRTAPRTPAPALAGSTRAPGCPSRVRKPAVAAGQGAHGRRIPRPPPRPPRARPRHGVRGGRLPEHLRVLVGRHGHLHDQRRRAARGPVASARSTPAIPLPLDPDEPERVAEAVARMGLAHAVVTCVARDDLDDGGAGALRRHHRGHPPPQPRHARSRCSSPTARATTASLQTIFDARPDVLNHNLETVRPAPAGGPAVGRLRPQPRACWPGPGRCRPHHQVGHSSSGWASTRTRCSPRWPTCGRSASRS